VVTEVGPVDIEVPRDRDGTFEPTIVRKRQRRVDGIDELLSLTAKGLTTGEVSAHLAEVYGAQVSKDTISNIADRVLGEMADWQSRPLDRPTAVPPNTSATSSTAPREFGLGWTRSTDESSGSETTDTTDKTETTDSTDAVETADAGERRAGLRAVGREVRCERGHGSQGPSACRRGHPATAWGS
jgi:hypothetical protein